MVKPETSMAQPTHSTQNTEEKVAVEHKEATCDGSGDSEVNFDVNEFFNFSIEGLYGFDWVF